jgi:6-pyruvoyl-tetrahydropterin synthase
MIKFNSTKVLELGSCAFRQWKAADNRPNAGDNASRCSKVHGYLLTAKFIFGSSKLDERNWVVDFGGLGELKDKLKYWFDHTLCLAANDPCLEDFKQLHNKGAVDLRVFEKGVGIERTAEFCYELATQFLKEKFGEGYWGYTYGDDAIGSMDITDFQPAKVGRGLAFNTDARAGKRGQRLCLARERLRQLHQRPDRLDVGQRVEGVPGRRLRNVHEHRLG